MQIMRSAGVVFLNVCTDFTTSSLDTWCNANTFIIVFILNVRGGVLEDVLGLEDTT